MGESKIFLLNRCEYVVCLQVAWGLHSFIVESQIGMCYVR